MKHWRFWRFTFRILNLSSIVWYELFWNLYTPQVKTLWSRVRRVTNA